MRILFGFLLLLFVVALVEPCSAAASNKEAVRASCKSQGFDVDTLLCGTCSRLRDITSPAVGQQCIDCCYSPYDKAMLFATQASLMRNPGLNEFLQSRKNKFNGLLEAEVVMKREEGAQLSLLKNGQVVNRILVNHWSANDLEDYIAQYFVKTS